VGLVGAGVALLVVFGTGLLGFVAVGVGFSGIGTEFVATELNSGGWYAKTLATAAAVPDSKITALRNIKLISNF
jgi:hypothetical protein